MFKLYRPVHNAAPALETKQQIVSVTHLLHALVWQAFNLGQKWGHLHIPGWTRASILAHWWMACTWHSWMSAFDSARTVPFWCPSSTNRFTSCVHNTFTTQLTLHYVVSNTTVWWLCILTAVWAVWDVKPHIQTEVQNVQVVRPLLKQWVLK